MKTATHGFPPRDVTVAGFSRFPARKGEPCHNSASQRADNRSQKQMQKLTREREF